MEDCATESNKIPQGCISITLLCSDQVEPHSQPKSRSQQQSGPPQTNPNYNRSTYITHNKDIPESSNSGDYEDWVTGFMENLLSKITNKLGVKVLLYYTYKQKS